MLYRYFFSNSVNDFTITAYADLYCDNQTYRNLIQSTLYIGSVMGLFIMNMLSDTKGRKYSFVLSLGIANIGIICKKYLNERFGSWSICKKHTFDGDFSGYHWLWRLFSNDHRLYNHF